MSSLVLAFGSIFALVNKSINFSSKSFIERDVQEKLVKEILVKEKEGESAKDLKDKVEIATKKF